GTGTAIPFDIEASLWPGANGINILANYAPGHSTTVFIPVTRNAGPETGGVFSAVGAGILSTSCGIGPGSALYCWGNIVTAEFGWRYELTPRAHLGGAGISFTRIATGQPMCAITAVGAAYCWGLNSDGQLGDGTRVTRERLAPVSGGLRFATISHQYGTTCGVATDGAGYCWGKGTSGTIGNGAFNDVTTPTAIRGGHRWSDIAVASGRVCGLTSAGAPYCWGGQVSNGANEVAATPTALEGGLPFTAIAGGGGSMCALDTAGAPYCWGMITYQFLTISSVPVRVAGGLTLRSLSVGYNHACGLTAAGAAYCWGTNRDGQLGNGTTSAHNVTTPVAVAGSRVFTSITAGMYYTCGVTANGAAFCWGAGGGGQLGTGLTAPSSTPRRVVDPA
ncbi:MAG TPA: hypothetical protein VE913_10400, partial [Longimicrobium sp.]|nr:hypothetical protein [Longimicrobium sp.]